MDSAEHGSTGHVLALRDLTDRKPLNEMGSQGSTLLVRQLGQRLLKLEPVVSFFQLIRHKFGADSLRASTPSMESNRPAGSRLSDRRASFRAIDSNQEVGNDSPRKVSRFSQAF